MRILTFDRPGGRELHLFMGRRLIGRRPAGKASWLIKPPYRLFVEEFDLPEADFEILRVSSEHAPRPLNSIDNSSPLGSPPSGEAGKGQSGG
jgi:hypothetical protein